VDAVECAGWQRRRGADVLDTHAAIQKVVGDDPAMTTPPDRFGEVSVDVGQSVTL
jgi:hypothetical protein